MGAVFVMEAETFIHCNGLICVFMENPIGGVVIINVDINLRVG